MLSPHALAGALVAAALLAGCRAAPAEGQRAGPRELPRPVADRQEVR